MRFNPPSRMPSGKKKKSVNISLPIEVDQAVEEAANAKGYTSRTGKAEFIRLMIQHCLGELKTNKQKPGPKPKATLHESYGSQED